MQIEYEEIYAEDKEELSELIQEWIDENILNMSLKCANLDLELQTK